MPQYLVAIHLPDNFDPSQSDPAMMDDIHALNKEMIAAGVRLLLAACPRRAARNRCARRPMASCS